ncbi:hypothetical protein [Sphingomonas sp. CFBP 8760]|uniref:hypothetical protein n=1 Tax=Sphingomonas sp. CFBP 8760 TaxID=2775282 RepID=UPI00177C1E79|nr:hypothetical protein [Sphingomonas sp. CFBP 8760]MBD8547164.1 hypothetical protein [Sphingomonas sp. CFBP 8760]
MYDDRQRRRDFVPAELLTDPAWDILLWVFIETEHGRRVTSLEAAVAAGVTNDIGLRWISALRKAGLVMPWWADDDSDAYVMLSDTGYRGMQRYLQPDA